MASRALARASAIAISCEEPRSATEERLSKPTASSASSTISESVTTSAKPRLLLRRGAAGDGRRKRELRELRFTRVTGFCFTYFTSFIKFCDIGHLTPSGVPVPAIGSSACRARRGPLARLPRSPAVRPARHPSRLSIRRHRYAAAVRSLFFRPRTASVRLRRGLRVSHLCRVARPPRRRRRRRHRGRRHEWSSGSDRPQHPSRRP